MDEQLKSIAPEIDALRQGMGWDEDDIHRKQIMISTTYGDSHPGSVHLDRLARSCGEGIMYNGGKPAHFTVTDMCDGIAQGHEGMNYSLVSREIIAGMVEIHQKSNVWDGMVLISSCDKSVPAHLMAMARLNIPAIHIPGGVMPGGPEGFTLEQMGTVDVSFKQNQINEEQFAAYQKAACPSCGACQFMGTAATMQVISEALGLALPHSALIPAHMKYVDNMAKAAGKAVVHLVHKNIRLRDIVNEKSLHNAIVVHGAVGGSTNALLHLPAVAHELSLDFDITDVDKIHRSVPFMVNTRPAGAFSTDMFWYAGGVPALMDMLRDKLYLDVMTVTGKTLRENLDECHYKQYEGYLKNYGLHKTDVIKQMNNQGAIAILKGNIAPDGAVVKYTGLPQGMVKFKGRARVFDNELSARKAIIENRIQPGDCIVIRYAGPKGSGMPEMFYTTQALWAKPALAASTAIITDGRFSGASIGPCIGHISPEAAEGGNIALLEEGDSIEIDIENRVIQGVDVDFNQRRKNWTYKPPEEKGILGIYKKLAVSGAKGGYMQV